MDRETLTAGMPGPNGGPDDDGAPPSSQDVVNLEDVDSRAAPDEERGAGADPDVAPGGIEGTGADGADIESGQDPRGADDIERETGQDGSEGA